MFPRLPKVLGRCLGLRGRRTSRERALHVVDDLVVVADDVLAMDDDGHLLAQVEPHEPGLLVLALRQAHVPLLTCQALLGDHQPHLQAPGSERGRRADTRGHSARGGGGACGEGGQRSHTGGDSVASSPLLGPWGTGWGMHPWGLVVGGTQLCPGDKGQSCLVVTGLGVTAGRTWDRISGSSVCVWADSLHFLGFMVFLFAELKY